MGLCRQLRLNGLYRFQINVSRYYQLAQTVIFGPYFADIGAGSLAGDVVPCGVRWRQKPYDIWSWTKQIASLHDLA